ncbi:TraR/DksA C4-type zinc finger protein [Parachitinimonas caeni]|uniref:TraR/DksA C4-type zinc finger protein n=1 Tax=Parachitinimonas caeni TaxID=3031301 RepID=A0ABT7DZV0_9NEIS|nr:TraR/DksA C4-type zinc finger protein [Parachitinimonas caeni]MDK2124167.1 TraR/DksA C4-type zinc finger protein [Parachitinimonas caeni]
MAKLFDQAAELEAQHREHALANQLALIRQLHSRPPADNCCDCDEPIPEPRRLAVPGCQRCIDCQTLSER